MKFLSIISIGSLLSTCVLAGSGFQQARLLRPQTHLGRKYLIELAPSETRWVTEEEKWALKLVCSLASIHPLILSQNDGVDSLTIIQDNVNFIDITDHQNEEHAPKPFSAAKTVRYPMKPQFAGAVVPLTKSLSKKNMKSNLEQFTSFHTRYYKSPTGIESASWLYERVSETVEKSGATDYGATVEKFEHPWGQFSIIARIPGQSNKTVVLGAHQDSINLFFPSLFAAPGADDDGSGTVTILESLRTLLLAPEVVNGSLPNTVEFQWYSAEEGGLLGSQAIFSEYKKQGRDVKAMLQQDMTGYVQGTLDAGEEESVGVIVDFVHPGLTEFIKEIITTVSIDPLLFRLSESSFLCYHNSTVTCPTCQPAAAMLVLTMRVPASMDIRQRLSLNPSLQTPIRRSTLPMTRSSISVSITCCNMPR